MPMRKNLKLLFLQICLCGMSQFTFFLKSWVASTVCQAGFGSDSCPLGIQCSYTNSKDEIQVPAPLLLWEGAKKKQCVSAFRPGYHCANTIRYSYSDFTCNWSAAFMLNNDMFILPSQSCVSVLPLKSPCISVGLCTCVTSKLIEELISMRWKTDVDKSTLQLCILVKKTK